LQELMAVLKLELSSSEIELLTRESTYST
jgi:hypothetical protein